MNPKLNFHSLVLILLIFHASFSFSFGRNQKDPLAISLRQAYGHHNNQNDRTNELEFPSLLKSKSDYNTHGLMTRFSRATRSPSSYSSSSPQIFNVDDFGARGDGTDDSQAFIKAWNRACSSKVGVILVPQNRVYHLKPITFSGPCKSSQLTMRISGIIKASPRRSDYEKDTRHWMVFDSVQNLRVEGGGTINGNGRKWWKNSCKINKALAVTFYECKNLRVANLRFKNAQQMHLNFQKCVNVQVVNLRVIAPGNSPNTDGIHITDTQNIQIMNSVIKTGDDCISIVSGSKNVRATDITCGPGHGISIGSLGAGNSEAEVSNVIVNRARFSGTTNGVRIKTWQGGSGYAKNIIFQNIAMRNVSNPIIIDQNYCDQDEPCHEQDSAVQISNVMYNNIKGTSDSQVAVKFECSKSFPCQGISLQNVNFVREGEGEVEASCENVSFDKSGRVSPKCSNI
ncbi:Glycoside hydrolase [Parasponia andersonii]|uniref:endo-polygalacturonase n=1 Tax=Parasponia andersonii TaxID=3476 RepID=A0A2P5DLR7_PARAD|nr:Glycoside hydrolase [Parasponia andersonii]